MAKKAAPILTNRAGKPVDQWTFADWDQFLREQVAAYQGDSYIVEDLMAANGWTAVRAQREIADPATLVAYLEDDGLASILADRTASKALKDALLKPRGEVIEALATAVKKLRVPKKRGPKGKMVAGQYQYEHIVQLRDQERRSFPFIATLLWGDAELAHRAQVQYAQAKRRSSADAGKPGPRRAP
jgi:hypothetical protein